MAKKLNTSQPLVISYMRFSTAEQLKGDSSRRQTDLADEWCKKHGRKLTDRLDDKGISAYRGRNSNSGDLATFLKLVEAGTVPAGSILLVEDLDRISRQKPHKALSLFFNIVDAGCTVITLRDGGEYSPGNLDMNRLMMSVMRFCLAHDESDKKSGRLAEAWKTKRKNIGDDVLTKMIPAWLRIEGDKIVEDKPKADIIRAMFALALDGHGLTYITREANRRWEGIGRTAHFARGTVNKILHNEQTIGIFQPHKTTDDDSRKTGKRREPVGKPIRGYYPAIVDETTFYAVQKMLRSRKLTGGPSAKYLNVFQGVIFNADDRSPMVIGNKGNGRFYVSAAAIEGRKGAAPYIMFPVVSLEAAILYELAQRQRLDLDETPDTSPARELAAVEGQLAGKVEKIGQLQKALLTMGDVGPVVEVLAQLEGERKALEARTSELKAEAAAATHSTNADALEEVAAIVADQQWGNPDLNRRTRLRSALRQLVKRIDCRTTKEGHRRRCEVSISLTTQARPLAFTAEIHVHRPGAIHTKTPSGYPLMDLNLNGEADTGEQRPTISSRQIEQIKKLWTASKGGSAIAQQLGVSISTVYRHKPADWKPTKFGRWHQKPAAGRAS